MKDLKLDLELSMEDQENLFNALSVMKSPDVYERFDSKALDKAADYLLYAFRDYLSLQREIEMEQEGYSEERIEMHRGSAEEQKRETQHLFDYI